MSASKILVVDDDPLVRDAVAQLLERAGFRVETHDSGFGLVMAIRTHRPDLVLLDVSMPGLRGDSALRALGHFEVEPPRVALFSGLPQEELQAKADELGIPALSKPLPPGELIECVSALLEMDPPRLMTG